MLYKFGNEREVLASSACLPDAVYTELIISAVVLDSEYGSERNYLEIGGYSIVIENANDITELKDILNYDTYPCEWATRVGKSEFISALYIINDDFSLMIFMPETIVPQAIMKELEQRKEYENEHY